MVGRSEPMIANRLGGAANAVPHKGTDGLGVSGSTGAIAEPGTVLTDRVFLLAQRLRRAGVSVSTTEVTDGLGATNAIGLADRELWRVALRSSFVKRSDQLGIFDDLFDRTFPLSRLGISDRHVLDAPNALGAEAADGAMASPSRVDGALGDDRLSFSDRLLAAIASGDSAFLRDLAVEAVNTHAALERGGSSERQYLLRVTRAIELGALLQRALRNARSSSEGLDARVRLIEANELIEEFRRLLAREITMRLAMLQPVETITTVKYPDDVAFLETTMDQRAELRRAIEPLARKLAARMAQRRRLRRTGRVDLRRTLRRSLAFGGVPLEPVFRAKRASRPDLIVLCDVSGSVAEFAHFVLSLVHALNEELQRLRTFVFVDGIADVSPLFGAAQHDLLPMHLVTQPGVVRGDGHSDYGSVLDEFLRVHGSTLRHTSTIIITGDARSNYRDARADSLRKIAERVHAVYWLNPEPVEDWDTTDSIVAEYKPHCSAVFEVRTTRQLVAAVDEIIAS